MDVRIAHFDFVKLWIYLWRDFMQKVGLNSNFFGTNLLMLYLWDFVGFS